jgi:hypothetical protein
MPNRSGVALIDALVAVVVLATAGVGLVTLLAQTASTVRGVRERERLIYRASSELASVSVLSGGELSGRVGETAQGAFVLRVVKPSEGVFDVSIIEPRSDHVLLRTTFYRPDSAHVAP